MVYDKDLHSERVVADGPYRFVRNPLYLGTWLLTAAISILMPPGGALFALVTVTLLIVAWVHAEEQKLTIERGDAYTAYLKKVPRFFPSIVPKIPSGAARPHWLQGFRGRGSSLGDGHHVRDLCPSLQRDHPGARRVDLCWDRFPGARDLATRNTSEFLNP